MNRNDKIGHQIFSGIDTNHNINLNINIIFVKCQVKQIIFLTAFHRIQLRLYAQKTVHPLIHENQNIRNIK